MATIHRLRHRWRCTAKHSISAAMLATLVLIAIAATVSICLAPANTSFFIKQAEIVEYKQYNLNTGQVVKTKNTHLNFTLVATNNSPRTEVWYGRMHAEIWYGPSEGAWVRTSAFMRAQEPPRWLPPGSQACFSASADYGYSVRPNPPNNSLVVVETKLWFRYGLASTLPFTVRFSCWHVDFVDRTHFPIRCS